ncbi:hypothetical protein K388_01340 [Streptomyces sp. KhCrAH-43]|uniref:hypothetical protein n=1 Tax=Streptomyces TaxID=1883 RepID=UPI00036336EF|nr:hypothetical protein [Streptomyces sp. KhCrAH-43]MYS38897.1 DUF461 domain-containing protein [Streptomyces sp. SID4920]MYX67089.1 DUF461 domain-containing protein [Streptomyces sp. SID8373]RAJ68589.1 hypothetical protein K388_01340 [Streptomyces sp. KhCrAH-43]
MSRSLRHGALAATAIAFSFAALTACGAGNNAQTLEVRPDNAATSAGTIKIQNVNVITQPERDAKGPAVVSATVFNTGSKAETLDSITLKGSSGSVQLNPAKGSGPVVVPAGGRVVFGGKGNASAVIENGDEATQNGNVQPLVFKFSRTGEVSLGASVVPAAHYFKGFGPSALPETPKTPDASPSGSPSGSASPNSSESPSGEASASSSASESGQPG